MNGTMWLRVSARGRWHRVTQETEFGAFETRCGRVFPRSQAATVAVGEQPGVLCKKCR